MQKNTGDKIANCRRFIEIAEGEQKYLDYSTEEAVSKLTESDEMKLAEVLENYCASLFASKMRIFRPALKGELSEIGRGLDMHINTFRIYVNNGGTDIAKMIAIFKPLSAAYIKKSELFA